MPPSDGNEHDIVSLLFEFEFLIVLAGDDDNFILFLELHAETLKANSKNEENKSSGWRDLELVLTFKPFLLLACSAVTTTTAAQVYFSY